MFAPPTPRMPSLAKITAPELDEILAKTPAVVIPVGSIEWHDRHLPLGADASKAGALADLIAEEVGCVSVPPIYFGYPRRMSKDPIRGVGTMCPDFDALFNYLLSVGKQFVDRDFRVLYFLTGHYERSQFYLIKLLARLLVDYARDCGKEIIAIARMEPDFTIGEGISANARESPISPGTQYSGGDHAGFFETSLALFLTPDEVRVDEIDEKYFDPARGGAPSRDWGEKWASMIVLKAAAEVREALAGREPGTNS